MTKIKAIKTYYKGVMFRSKLEAQWAATFDSLNIDWTYEPEGYCFEEEGVKYLPDFYLSEQDIFFEVKGIMNNYDWKKINLLRKYRETVIGYSNGKVSCYDERSIAGKTVKKVFRESQIDYMDADLSWYRFLSDELATLKGESIAINEVFTAIEGDEGTESGSRNYTIGYTYSAKGAHIDDYLLKRRYEKNKHNHLAQLLMENYEKHKVEVLDDFKKPAPPLI